MLFPWLIFVVVMHIFDHLIPIINCINLISGTIDFRDDLWEAISLYWRKRNRFREKRIWYHKCLVCMISLTSTPNSYKEIKIIIAAVVWLNNKRNSNLGFTHCSSTSEFIFSPSKFNPDVENVHQSKPLLSYFYYLGNKESRTMQVNRSSVL